MEYKCKTRLATDVSGSRYQPQMHILYTGHTGPCHSFMTQDMEWENILPRMVQPIKEVLLQHQKQTKEDAMPGAEPGVVCCSIAFINFVWQES